MLLKLTRLRVLVWLYCFVGSFHLWLCWMKCFSYVSSWISDTLRPLSSFAIRTSSCIVWPRLSAQTHANSAEDIRKLSLTRYTMGLSGVSVRALIRIWKRMRWYPFCVPSQPLTLCDARDMRRRAGRAWLFPDAADRQRLNFFERSFLCLRRWGGGRLRCSLEQPQTTES